MRSSTAGWNISRSRDIRWRRWSARRTHRSRRTDRPPLDRVAVEPYRSAFHRGNGRGQRTGHRRLALAEHPRDLTVIPERPVALAGETIEDRGADFRIAQIRHDCASVVQLVAAIVTDLRNPEIGAAVFD